MLSPISVTRSFRLRKRASFRARCSPDATASVSHAFGRLTTAGTAQPEAAVLAAEEQRPAAEPVRVRLELVDEAAKRPQVVERVAFDAKRKARKRTDARFPTIAGDRLVHADERGQQAAGAVDVPVAVEHAHKGAERIRTAVNGF